MKKKPYKNLNILQVISKEKTIEEGFSTFKVEDYQILHPPPKDIDRKKYISLAVHHREKIVREISLVRLRLPILRQNVNYWRQEKETLLIGDVD